MTIPVMIEKYPDDDEVSNLHSDFQTSHNAQGLVRCANRSAYMWDAGLWKAFGKSTSC
ncbi:hypothetical protein FNYG_06095 [Fusarium nygamai]|uniref:Uncharacterized protein n=1 Tax=Gibberella nygamai TaxID=42673 RepID=A0A2K0WE01_GIBNY|nr:hypothetical protein FNYG_06095 [Fusarium nygamai]